MGGLEGLDVCLALLFCFNRAQNRHGSVCRENITQPGHGQPTGPGLGKALLFFRAWAPAVS